MEQSQKMSKWYSKPAFKVSAICVVSLLFVGSIILSIFSGGELFDQNEADTGIKGILKLEENNYQQSYFAGDTFSFDKDENKVTLVAKDPAIEDVVQVDNLPGPEYGFVVRKIYDEDNNLVSPEEVPADANLVKRTLRKSSVSTETSEGVSSDSSSEATTSEEEEISTYTYVDSEFYEDAEDITMEPDMGTIYLTSKRYQDLKIELPTEVINGSIDESKLADSLLLEAETALIYKDDTLLTSEDLATLPDTNKPFLSTAGTSVSGTECSGGACLRSFGTNNMRVDFEVISSVAQEVDLTIKLCLRPSETQFDSNYVFTVNGISYESIDSQVIPAGPAGQYFECYDLQTVKVNVNRGINVFSFVSGSSVGTASGICNLDAIQVSSSLSNIGTRDVIVMEAE